MGLFNFYKKNQVQSSADIETHPVEIPKDVFIEDIEPKRPVHSSNEINGIEAIYVFLQIDYESRGYSDALTNPDDSYKSDNIKLIKLDLQILIQKVTTYYKDLIRELDFHISSRSRAGLIDLVEELKTHKTSLIRKNNSLCCSFAIG